MDENMSRWTPSNWDFTWTNTTGTTDNVTFTTNTSSSTWYPIHNDKDWMPYFNEVYDPMWHKKYARYKIQIESMWD